MSNDQQNIQNDAPNQGAQGQFHGNVTTGTHYNQQDQRIAGNQHNAGRDIHIYYGLWQHLGQHIADKSQEQGHWDQVRWDEAARQYRNRMLRLYSEIKMFGSTRPIKLEDIFTDVYILDKPSAYRRFSIHQIRKDPERLERSQRLNGLAMVQQPERDRLFILGKPGAGKTTFLKYLTLQALQGKIEAIPIFVTLKEWAGSGKELIPFLVQQFAICNFPDAERFITYTLEQGRALILFDGLDEVQQEGERRTPIIQALKNFSNTYLDSQMVVSCRIAATDYSFTRFTYVEVADFDDAQVRTFVTRWFGENEHKRDMFFAAYNREEHRGLRELGRVPLLLSMLCLGFEQTLSFPQRRVEIYDDAIDALLRKWDAWNSTRRDEIYRHLSPDRKKQVLERVAVATFSWGDYFIEQDTLARLLADAVYRLPAVDRDTTQEVDGKVILKAIAAQHGILIERAYQIYSFAHLSFQEYFTARFIANNADEQKLRGLFQHHLTSNHWREVFLLTTSLLSNADVFVYLFRQALDEMIADDPQIVEIVQWAAQQAQPTSAVWSGVERRVWYWSITLSHASDRDRDRDRALTRTLTRTLTRALTRTLTRAGTRVRELASDLALTRNRDRDRDRTLALTRANTRALDLTLAGTSARASALALASDLARTLTIALAHTHASASALARASDRTLTRDRDRDRDLASALDRASTSANVLARDLANARAHALARNLARTCDLANNLDRALASTNALARDLASARTSDLAQMLKALLPHAFAVVTDAFMHFKPQREYPLQRDHSLIWLIPGLRDIISAVQVEPEPEILSAFAVYLSVLDDWSTGSCFPDLEQPLRMLVVPDANAESSEWDALDKRVQEIVNTHIDSVIGWELTEEQAERAADYLTATKLLQECLQLAAVSDRQAVEDTLLLPPGAWHLPSPGSAPTDDPARWWQA